jgi:hypothetical protein
MTTPLRQLERVSIGLTWNDGTATTFRADNPVRADVEVTGPPLAVDPAHPLALDRIEAPSPRRVRVEFEAHPAHPVVTEMATRPVKITDGSSLMLGWADADAAGRFLELLYSLRRHGYLSGSAGETLQSLVASAQAAHHVIA